MMSIDDHCVRETWIGVNRLGRIGSSTLDLESHLDQVASPAAADRLDVRLDLTRTAVIGFIQPPCTHRSSTAMSPVLLIHFLAERPLLPEHVVVVLGEAVGLVADVLEQPQGERAAAQDDRVGPAGDVDLLLLLGQRDQGRRGDAERLEGVEGRVELALAAVDQEDVGERLVALLEALDPAA